MKNGNGNANFNESGFWHEAVNHSEYFIDLKTGDDWTQTIEISKPELLYGVRKNYLLRLFLERRFSVMSHERFIDRRWIVS